MNLRSFFYIMLINCLQAHPWRRPPLYGGTHIHYCQIQLVLWKINACDSRSLPWILTREADAAISYTYISEVPSTSDTAQFWHRSKERLEAIPTEIKAEMDTGASRSTHRGIFVVIDGNFNLTVFVKRIRSKSRMRTSLRKTKNASINRDKYGNSSGSRRVE